MSADRFGFIAMPDLTVCLKVFFKLSSGLDTESIRFDPEAYRQEMERVLEAFRSEMSDVGVSHPINPIRLKALQLFAASELYTSLPADEHAQEDESLAEGMEELVEVLLTKGHSPLSAARRRFIAAAGLLVAGIDDEIGRDEMDAILEPLAAFTHFPARYFHHVLEDRNVQRVFNESATVILEANPGERFSMFRFMVSVALADRQLHKREVELLFEVGEGLFGFQRKEIAQALAEALQQEFVPRLTVGMRRD